MAVQFSFYDDLTTVPDPNKVHEATELVKNLIHIVGHDVTAFKRNTLQSYGVILRSQGLFKGINALIDKIDEEELTDVVINGDDYWNDYESYTKAIDPLEEVLFELSDLGSKEYLDTALPAEHSVLEWEGIIKSWIENRDRLKKITEKLNKDELKGLVQAPYNPSVDLAHDDCILVSAISRDIKDHTLVDDIAFEGKGVKDTKEIAGKLSSKISKATDEKSMALSVQSVMLIHGAMEVAVKSTDNAVKEKMESPEVWNRAANLLTKLSEHLTGGKLTLAELQKEWDNYLEYLKKLDVPLGNIPKEYYELRKIVRSVRRPYHSRTLVLVSHCRIVADEFKRKPTNHKLKPLISVVKAVVATLQVSAKAIKNEIVAKYDEDTERTAAGQAFNSAEIEIQKCFKAFGMEADWAAKATEMSNALANDKRRIVQMNQKLDNHPYPPTKPTAAAKTKVKVNKTNGDLVTYDGVDVTTPLSAVLWKLVQADSSLVPGSQFRKTDAEGDVIGMDKTVKDVAGEELECVLYLAPGPSESSSGVSDEQNSRGTEQAEIPGPEGSDSEGHSDLEGHSDDDSGSDSGDQSS